jgi:hypothetical protein
MNVAALTEEHIGWMIQVTEPGPLFCHRTFVLLKIRGPWTVDSVTRVGLLAPAGPPWAGQEYIYPAETPCEVLRQVRKPRKRRQSA